MKHYGLPLIIIIFLILIIFTNNVNASAEEYISEFNNKNEVCEIIDYFVYDVHCPTMFNSKKSCPTVPIFYKCCSNVDCVTIIFDIQNKKFLYENYNTELINLNFVKYNLNEGNLLETQFDLKGFDICSYFGNRELRQESINLATSAAETITPLISTKKAKDTISTAKKLGVVGKFNPTILIASVSCNYDNENLKRAIESLASCNVYLSNIKNNYAKEDYLDNLTSEVNGAKENLNQYMNSGTAQVRGIINKLINVIMGIFKFFINFDLDKDNKLDIEKTELELSQTALNQISNYNPYLKNPDNHQILESHELRITQKEMQFNKAYTLFIIDYKKADNNNPSFITTFLTNLFMNPNYNISEGRFYFRKSSKSKNQIENFYKGYKYNSAIKEISNSNKSLELSNSIFLREKNIIRNFDKKIFLIILIMIIIGYFIYKEYY